MKEHLLSESNFNSFIFNRQHVVQKSLMTFLGLYILNYEKKNKLFDLPIADDGSVFVFCNWLR